MNRFVRRLFILTLAIGFSSLSQVSGESPQDIYKITDAAASCQSEFHEISIPRGKEELLADLKGPGKVTYFYITDDSAGKWYPGLVLKIYWDDAKEPSVQAPLADFFGAIGGRTVDYSSTLMQVNHACFMCYLPMPFSKCARFVLANDGDEDYSRKMAYGIDHEEGSAFSTEKSRLHCEWRRSSPVVNGIHTLLEVRGRGQYVGSFLQTSSRSPGIWFGEGDTLFQLDGKSMVHSPGSEDEYGSCWEDPHWRTFSSPACGHILNENGINRMYRWYIANPVRFRESLKVSIQNQHENGKPTTGEDSDDYTSLTFWYQEGVAVPESLPPFKDRIATPFLNGR